MIANVFEVIVKKMDSYFEMAPSRVLHDPNSAIGFDSKNVTPFGVGGDNDPTSKIMSLLQQGDQQESIQFALNKVTPILINIEEEGNLRPAERFSRVSASGNREPIRPDIRLNLYILFVSHFYDYTDALYYLGLIVKCFQAYPVLDHQNTPGLHKDIDKLFMELVTLPLSEQNEVWGALRSAYRPSMMYKVKMLIFQDEPSVMGAGEIKEVKIDTGDFE